MFIWLLLRVSSVSKGRHRVFFLFPSLSFKNIVSLSIQLVFSLSSQQQKLDFNTLNDWLRQQCLKDGKNSTTDASKCISELIFANFIDSFTTSHYKTFVGVKKQSPVHVLLSLLLLTCFPALNAGFMISRVYHRLPVGFPRTPVSLLLSDQVYFYFPLDGMLVHCRVTPSSKFTGTH